jgi:hypothetical protein
MKRLLSYAGFLILFVPSLVSAAEVGVNGTTIIRFEEKSVPGFADERLVPATQFLGIDADKIGNGNLSLHLYGWGRVDLDKKSTDEHDTDGDLSYGYLDYRLPQANGAIRAGRFFHYEGVAAEQLDGVHVRSDIYRWLTFSAYGGAPVQLDRDKRSKGDYIFGGRVSGRVAGIMELGVSGLQEGRVLLDKSTGETKNRQLVGGDLWFSPHRMIEVSGRTSFNLATHGIAEHGYLLTLRPVTPLTISGEYNENRFKNYFTFSNIRSLFDPTQGDLFRSYGGTVTYVIAKPVEVSADYRHYRRDTIGNSDRFGGELRLTLLENKLRAGASYHRLDAGSDINSYHEMRGYVLYTTAKYSASLDVIEHRYDESIFGKKDAFEVAGSLGYRILPNVAISGDLSYGQNPQYNDELKGLVRLTFNYSTANKGAGK